MGKYPEHGSSVFWGFVDQHAEKLNAIVKGYHPSYGRRYSQKAKKNNPNAEAARQDIVAEIEREGPVDFAKAVKERKADEVVNILNATWFGVPESVDCWDIPGFSQLCTICEEGIPNILDGVSEND